MDTNDFSEEMWADVAEVIFQGMELSEYEQILRAEEQSAVQERQLALPTDSQNDFVAMFFNRYQGTKNQIEGRQAVVNALATLLKTALTCTGDPAVGAAFREQMMQYIAHRNAVFQRTARTLIGDYMEPAS